jgi:hypothetical protein
MCDLLVHYAGRKTNKQTTHRKKVHLFAMFEVLPLWHKSGQDPANCRVGSIVGGWSHTHTLSLSWTVRRFGMLGEMLFAVLLYVLCDGTPVPPELGGMRC